MLVSDLPRIEDTGAPPNYTNGGWKEYDRNGLREAFPRLDDCIVIAKVNGLNRSYVVFGEEGNTDQTIVVCQVGLVYPVQAMLVTGQPPHVTALQVALLAFKEVEGV